MKKFKSMNELLVHYCDILLSSKEVSARNSKQKEVIFENFELVDPTNINISLPSRKFNKNYAIAEWLWYISANPSSKNIGKLAKIWRMISDKHQEVESNYGVYLKPQWNWVKNEIIKDLDTRRATFVINQPYHKYKNSSDYPCTQYIQFFVRENKLHIGVNMRSNDLIYGLCNDVFTFSLFQQMMLNELNSAGLNLELGSYFHFAGSLHIYEHHYEMAKNICKSIDKPVKTCKLNKAISWDVVDENFPFPVANLEKNQIYKYVEKHMEEIFNNE